ncbi:MAG: two-component regulator propeller domain-containing protein [Bacteroidales bacterium]|jgi:signal transduction histidine kinase/ligand-binding sensor domain-containing protein
MELLFEKTFHRDLFITAIYLLLTCTNLATGQETAKPGITKPNVIETQGVGFFTNFNTENGLPFDGIHHAMMDRKGNLWLGTWGGGVIRYDGKSFTQYTVEQGLANNFVTKFIEDRTGNLWFGTAGGASRYNGVSFANFTTANGLTTKIVYCILEDKTGNVWFGTKGGGISRFDGKSFTNFTMENGLVNNTVYSILEDKTGDLWFGTGGGGVSRYDGKSFTNFNTGNGLANNVINCIVEDKTGNLWFGTEGGGVSRYDGNSFANFTTGNGLVNNFVKWITEDKRGNLWFGTFGGVSQYDGKSFTHFSTKDGLASISVTCITEDKAGNLWFSTEASGLSCYNGKSFIHFTAAQGLSRNLIWCISEDKAGNLWFGSLGGASRYDGKSFTNFTSRDGLINNIVQSITADKKGNLWIGTSKGISRFNGKSFTNFSNKDGLLNGFIRCITEDKTGNLWFGTNGGVSRYDMKSFIHFTTSDGLCNNTVNSITQDHSGNLWFGTDGGVSRYNGKSFATFTSEQGLANNLVSCILEDKMGNLWIGTDGGGISRFDGKSFATFTTVEGLPDNIVSQVALDAQDNIVIGTNDGLAVITAFRQKELSGNVLGEFPAQNNLTNDQLKGHQPKIIIYNSATGYPVKDVNFGQNGMYRDSKGILWIGTGSDKTGLVRFDQSAVNTDPAPPFLFIQSIKINNENIWWDELIKDRDKTGDSLSPGYDTDRKALQKKFGDIRFESITPFYPLPVNLVLPPGHNNITFDFGAIELLRPNLVKYQYILEGYDQNWSPVNTQTSASFGNIREGTYTFKVKAQCPNESWGEPIAYTFKVLPPWWRTWWANLTYTLLTIFAIILIVWLYTRRLIRRNTALQNTITEKEKIQAELTLAKDKAEESDRLKSAFLANMSHEIRTPMNVILGFTELLKEADLTGEEQQNYIGIIEKSGDRLLNIITNIVVFSQLESGAVETAISETNINGQLDLIYSFFKPQADQKGVQFLVNKRLQDEEAIIKSDKEKIYSILTNLVKNAMNFTPSGSIEFGCEKKGKFLEFYVKDTGIGIADAQKEIIFNRFRQCSEELTRNREGAGLGLSISKGYVEILGGKIWVESTLGVGSTFYFTIKIR